MIQISLTPFLSFLALSLSCLAQVPRPPTNCSSDIRDIASSNAVNSTGIVPFRFSEHPSSHDWYSSITYDYSYYDPSEIGPYETFNMFLSVPKDAQGTGCQYRFDGLNISATGEGINGCEGVLSQQCIEHLQKLPGPQGHAAQSIRVRCDDEFLEGWEWKNATIAACGSAILGSSAYGENITTIPFGFSITNPDCNFFVAPPGITLPELDVTKDYRSIRTAMISFANRQFLTDPVDDFDTYDLRVRQTIVMVYTALLGDSSDVQSRVVCVAPSNVTQGGRIPQSQWPPSIIIEEEPSEEGSGLRLGIDQGVFLMAGLAVMIWVGLMLP